MLTDFLVAEISGHIVGVVGREPLGDCVLFRSLAIAPDFRGQGLAGALTAKLEHCSKAGGAQTAYLLTNTAGKFAEKHGFRVLPRTEAPATIQHSTEFRHICCTSALCMHKNL